MRNLLITIVFLAIAAGASAQSDTQPLIGSIVNPCNGEPLTYEGQCHYITRTSDTTTHVHAICQAEGIGAFGNEYMFGSNSMQRIDTACAGVQEFSQRTRLITAQSMPNAFITMRFLVTFDANCQPHPVVEETEAECRGRSSSGF
jgi:hypothetical protein